MIEPEIESEKRDGQVVDRRRRATDNDKEEGRPSVVELEPCVAVWEPVGRVVIGKTKRDDFVSICLIRCGRPPTSQQTFHYPIPSGKRENNQRTDNTIRSVPRGVPPFLTART